MRRAMNPLEQRLAEAIAACQISRDAGLDVAAVGALLTPPPKAGMGDKALPCFAFAKALKVAPPAAAARLKGELESASVGAHCNAPLQGPGGILESLAAMGPYLNFTFNHAALAKLVLEEIAAKSSSDAVEDWHYGDGADGHGADGKPRVCVIDLSSPNIAKPLGVHHLRSTMIGNSLKKIHESQGWVVVGLNYLGDWGTGFGKLIAGFAQAHPDIGSELSASVTTDARMEELEGQITIAEMNRVYVEFNKRIEQDTGLRDAGKAEFAVLEAALLDVHRHGTALSNPRARRADRLWRIFRKSSIWEFTQVYRLLGLTFVHWPSPEAPEPTAPEWPAFVRKHGVYSGEHWCVRTGSVEQVIQAAKQCGQAVQSEGALVLFLDTVSGSPPLMLVKDDGATSYHARDMASAKVRVSALGGSRLIYVVGNEQSLHFRQLFKALDLVYPDFKWTDNCHHVGFGLYLSYNEETKKWEKLSTRKGRSILLHDLLNEAIESVKTIIREKNAKLAADENKLNEVARKVGVGAVVFNDLKNGRNADIKFDWDAMLSFSGETGPYMLYQYVRLLSVRRKYEAACAERGWDAGESKAPDYSLLKLPQEKELVNALAAFPAAVSRACREYEPSVISRYLLDLSGLFSSYWAATREEGIVGEDKHVTAARIALVDGCRKVLGKGLVLLGLQLVDEM
jgi:arginyl-tRNA synthetase